MSSVAVVVPLLVGSGVEPNPVVTSVTMCMIKIDIYCHVYYLPINNVDVEIGVGVTTSVKIKYLVVKEWANNLS